MTPNEQRERDEQALREAEAKLVEVLSVEPDWRVRELLNHHLLSFASRVGYLRELVRRHELRDAGNSTTD